jgi:glycine/D-amino acid oxidase-like deaminating enzyme
VASESAEVVIVGGGAMGASVAYHLTELGVTDVVLLERETLASGSTSKSAGGIRAQFADELNIAIALRSIAEFATFAERTGTEIDFA